MVIVETIWLWKLFLLKIVTYKVFVYKSYTYIYIYKQDLGLNNVQEMICRKT